MNSYKIVIISASSLVCTLVLAWFLTIRMPFYLGDQDPAYLYLSGAVDIAQTHKTLFLDNPGILPQVLGAVIIQITHMVTNTDLSLIENVLTNPELFLAVYSWVQLGLTSIALFLLGLTVLRLHGSAIGALMLQISSLLVSHYMLYRLVGVTAIAMQLFLTILLMIVILFYIDRPLSAKHQLKWPLLFAVLLSMMAMTKITVLPLIILPLVLLPSWKIRFVYLTTLVALSSLLLLTFAADYERFFSFIWNAATRQGLYGSGETGLDIAASLRNLTRTLRSDPLYLILLTFFSVKAVKERVSGKNDWHKTKSTNYLPILLLAICLVGLGQWLIVLKQFRQYYLLPAALLLALAVYYYWFHLFSSAKTKTPLLASGICVMLLLILFQTPKALSWASWRIDFRESCRDVATHIETNYPYSPVASVNSGGTMAYALRTFRSFSRDPKMVTSLIANLYPQETVIRVENDATVAVKLAEAFKERPALAIVKKNLPPSKVKGLHLSYKGKYHNIYILE